MTGQEACHTNQEATMPDTTTSLTDLITRLQECLKDNDRDAAAFLRDGVLECVQVNGSWLSDQEQDLLSSF